MKGEAERDRVMAEELEILEQLDRLLPAFEDFDRNFRFDPFCSASMLCHSVDNYSGGLDYAKAALELAPNDGRPHICGALKAVHAKETRAEAMRSCLRGVRLPPVAGGPETVSEKLELMKLELERARDRISVAELAEGTKTLYPVVAEEVFPRGKQSD